MRKGRRTALALAAICGVAGGLCAPVDADARVRRFCTAFSTTKIDDRSVSGTLLRVKATATAPRSPEKARRRACRKARDQAETVLRHRIGLETVRKLFCADGRRRFAPRAFDVLVFTPREPDIRRRIEARFTQTMDCALVKPPDFTPVIVD